MDDVMMRRVRRLRRRPKARQRQVNWPIVVLCAALAIIVWAVRMALVPSSDRAVDLLPPARFLPVYVRAGEQYGIPWAFLATINEIETNYDRIQPMVSAAGALGPMQFMPATWREYGRSVLHPGRAGDPFNLVDAVFACARLLKQWGMTPERATPYWIARFAGAYDAGPGNWDNGSNETVHYRTKAVMLFQLIEREVPLKKSVLADWNRLSIRQIATIARGGGGGTAMLPHSFAR